METPEKNKCRICGAMGFGLSLGGPDVCAECDCGSDPHERIRRLNERIEGQKAHILKATESARKSKQQLGHVKSKLNEWKERAGLNDDRAVEWQRMYNELHNRVLAGK